MKKVILLATAALLFTGVSFANDGGGKKKCCKKSKSCCHHQKSCCKSKTAKM